MGNQPNRSKALNVFLKIVAIIFGILFIAALIVPNSTNVCRIGPRNITFNQIAALESILSQYYTDTGQYPPTSEGLKALVKRPTVASGAKWNGPYTTGARFVDGWGRKLHYICPGVHNPKTFDIWSYGADGIKGGNGVNADIGN